MVGISPHNAGIIMDLFFCCTYCKIQQISFILCQQILNRKHYLQTSIFFLPVINLCPFDQTVHSQIAHFVADPCDSIIIFINMQCQLSVLRKYGNTLSCHLVSHILNVSMKSIDLFSIKLCIHHRKFRRIH